MLGCRLHIAVIGSLWYWSVWVLDVAIYVVFCPLFHDNEKLCCLMFSFLFLYCIILCNINQLFHRCNSFRQLQLRLSLLQSSQQTCDTNWKDWNQTSNISPVYLRNCNCVSGTSLNYQWHSQSYSPSDRQTGKIFYIQSVFSWFASDVASSLEQGTPQKRSGTHVLPQALTGLSLRTSQKYLLGFAFDKPEVVWKMACMDGQRHISAAGWLSCIPSAEPLVLWTWCDSSEQVKEVLYISAYKSR